MRYTVSQNKKPIAVRWNMAGPTLGQAQTLRKLGCDPNDFKNRAPGDIFELIRARMAGLAGPRRAAHQAEEYCLARKKSIEQQGFVSGMTVLIRYRGKEMRKVIEEISPDFYIKLEGRKHLFPPQALTPLMT